MEQYTKNDDKACFNASRERFENLIDTLTKRSSLELAHEEVEEIIDKQGRDVLRQALQDHLQLRFMREKRHDSIICCDGTHLTHVRVQERGLRSIFGDVRVRRFSYGDREEGNLRPMDAHLNLPTELYSHGLVRRVIEDAIKMSYDAAIDSVRRTTGVQVPKRQMEQQLRYASLDFRDFYETRAVKEAQKTDDLLVLSTDGKGVVMRYKDLRFDTRVRIYNEQEALKGGKCKLASGKHRKRMSTVAAVYSEARNPRNPEQMMGNDKPPDRTTNRHYRAKDKRVWASLMREQEEVIDEVFREALRRDPKQKRQWVYLVDGDLSQLRRIERKAKLHHVTVTVICDFIHVLEYLWEAAHCFYSIGKEEASKWVEEKALEILRGKSSYVAAGMRRKATLSKLSEKKRKKVDDCARYLLNHRKYLKYDKYLSSGYPIATGVIEGTCRHLINDRLDITGARWSLYGAETLLRMRAIWASGDFDDYWKYHCQRFFERYHRYVLDNLQHSNKILKVA